MSGTAGNETVLVSAFGYKQMYSGVAEIDADCNTGDTVTIDPGVLANAKLNGGGAGMNHLTYSGSGSATLTAKGTGNQLTGGSGQNTLDARMAAGNDLLIGGPGTNVFYAALNVPNGGVGDTMVAGPNGDVMNGGNGPDHFLAGAGNDTMNGGTGNDIFSWIVGDGSPTISANASYINSLEVSGLAGDDTFKVDPYMGTGVTVNANGVAVSAKGISLLNIDGDQGKNQTTIDDLSGTSLKTVGVNTGELHTPDTSGPNTTTLYGPSADTTMRIDEFTGTVTTSIDAQGNAQTADGTTMEVTGLGPRFLVANPEDEVVVNLGGGHNTSTIATSTLGGTLVVNGGTGANEFDIQSISGPTTVAGPGSNTFNVGSTEPVTGGVVRKIQGPLTLNGSGQDTANIDDTGNTGAGSASLTATMLTGLGMGPKGIAYSGLAALNIYLGSGGNQFTINVASGANLPATTTINGGASNSDTLNAAWAGDFNGALNLFAFESSTVVVVNNFNGAMSDTLPGNVQSITVGGSVTTTGSMLAGGIGSMTVGEDIAGTVHSQSAIGSLTVGTPSYPGSVTPTGVVSADQDITSMLVYGNVAGIVQAGGTIQTMTVDGSVIPTPTAPESGTISAGIIRAANINTLTVAGAMAGLVNVSANLNSMSVGQDMAGLIYVGNDAQPVDGHRWDPGKHHRRDDRHDRDLRRIWRGGVADQREWGSSVEWKVPCRALPIRCRSRFIPTRRRRRRSRPRPA